MNEAEDILSARSGQKRTSRWLSAGVFVTVLCAYLIGESRTPPYIDSRQIYDVAESLIYRGTVQIPVGGGVSYAQQPFLPSAIHLPGVALRKVIAADNPDVDRLVKPLTSHVGSQIVGAIGCLVFFRLLLFLGASAGAASLGTLVLAFATLLPIYARTAWSEALQASAFIGFFSSLLRLYAEPRRSTALWLGVWAGVLVNAKYVFAATLPGALLLLAYRVLHSRQRRAYLVAGLWTCVGGIPFLAITIWYNRARSGGSVADTGYAPVQTLVVSVFREELWLGLWSQFFALGKSIFLYSPPLVLAMLALRRLRRTQPAHLWALFLTVVPVLGVYAKFAYWAGDWCWGPRYQLFLVAPVLALGLGSLDDALRRRRSLVLAAWAGAFCLGLWVQVAGASQYWDHFIRVSKTVQTEWLGAPNRRGAFVPELRGQCDPCFEDLYARTYTPAFQPIEAHGWYLRHHLRSHPWAVAAQDMPLRRYTSLDFDIVRRWYENPAWDWWKLSFVGRYKTAGDVLLVVFVAGLLAGGAMWLRGLRGRWGFARRRSAPSAREPEEDGSPGAAPAPRE